MGYSPRSMICTAGFRDRAITVSLGILLAGSAVGLTLMCSWLNTGAPDGFVRPFASSIWLAALSTFFAGDTIVTVWNGRSSCLCFGPTLEPRLCAALVVVELFALLGYGLAGRWDAFGWAWCLVITLSIAFYHARAAAADRRSKYAAVPPGYLDLEGSSVNDEFNHRFHGSGRHQPRKCSFKFGVWIRNALRVLAIIFMLGLLGGSIFEAQGYLRYAPQGRFVTVTHSTGLSQTVLAQCVTPPNYVPGSYPTFWSEVGGGGHSMSDLWGLRDELVNTYGVRYCSCECCLQNALGCTLILTLSTLRHQMTCPELGGASPLRNWSFTTGSKCP